MFASKVMTGCEMAERGKAKERAFSLLSIKLQPLNIKTDRGINTSGGINLHKNVPGMAKVSLCGTFFPLMAERAEEKEKPRTPAAPTLSA